MNFFVPFLFALVTIVSSAPHESLLSLRPPRQADNNKNSNSAPVNFGFPVYGAGSWPGFGGSSFPTSRGNWPQAGGGLGGGNLHGRFNFDDMPNVEAVSSGVTCTYSNDGKQKCTHHHKKN
ncbi:uncharacterized protein LOC131437868 [Malaya genurostris]|uniref:uncharacterized protein LOC131437868 n=1 Tax=Malaya genurostris TaxID=325434 RepID=UPI0026F39780|nr:uncharacterized protein LOC131437868 [Malaya genurostris]